MRNFLHNVIHTLNRWKLDYLPSFFTYCLSCSSALCTPFLRSVLHRIAFCTISEIFSICNEHTGGNHIDTPFYTGVETRTSCQLLVTIPAFPPRAQEEAFSGRNGKPCHLDSARSEGNARSLRPTQNIKDLGKWNFFIWWKSHQSNGWECWTACTKVFIMACSHYSLSLNSVSVSLIIWHKQVLSRPGDSLGFLLSHPTLPPLSKKLKWA